MTRPPGWIFLGTSLVIGAFLVEAASRADMDVVIVVGVPWLALVGIALLRFVLWLLRRREIRSAGPWIRWGATALLLVGSLWAALSDVPFRVRWTLSRGPLDAMAASVLAGERYDQSWVGLYPPGHVDLVAGGVRFATGSALFWTNGLAWVPDGIDPNEDQAWGSGTYKALGGGWWTWADQGWDD